MPMKAKTSKTHFFSFDPSEWLNILTMQDDEAGKIFKAMIIQLAKNEVPESSPAFDMYQRTEEFREKQRAKANARWHTETDGSQEPSFSLPSAPLKKITPPSIEEVYELCEARKFPPPLGKEWFDWMESKNWMLSGKWQNALIGFVKNKYQKGCKK